MSLIGLHNINNIPEQLNIDITIAEATGGIQERTQQVWDQYGPTGLQDHLEAMGCDIICEYPCEWSSVGNPFIITQLTDDFEIIAESDEANQNDPYGLNHLSGIEKEKLLTKAFDDFNFELVKALLEKGGITYLDYFINSFIYQDDPSPYGEGTYTTPITEAIKVDDVALLDLWMKAGADLDFPSDKPGFNPVSVAIQNNSMNVLKRLIELGADIKGIIDANLKVKSYTLFGYAINRDIKDGIDTSFTPISMAAKYDNIEAMKLLEANGINLDEEDGNGCTPLFVAIQNNSTNTLRFLMENGASFENTFNTGFTPISMAAKYDNIEAIEILKENGINLNKEDNNGCTPLFVAIQNNNTKALRFLIENGVDCKGPNHEGISPISMAAKHGSMDALRLLIELGADPHQEDNSGVTPLIMSIRNNHPKAVRFLAGLKVDLEKPDRDGITPFLNAIQSDGFLALEALLEFGVVDVNQTDLNGKTAISIATEKGYLGAVELLVESGADVNLSDMNGTPPFAMQDRSFEEQFLEAKGLSSPAEDKAYLLCSILKKIRVDTNGLSSKLIDYMENLLLEMPFSHALRFRREIVTAVSFQESNSLYNLSTTTELITASQTLPGIGAFFQGLGGTSLSGSFLRVVKRKKVEGDIHQIDLKLSHQARDQVGLFLDDFQDAQRNTETISILKEIGVEISISEGEYSYEAADDEGFFKPALEMCRSIEILFNGIGKVIIGNEADPNVLRRRVTIQLEGDLNEGIGIQHLHTISSLLGLGPIALEANADILEKRKVAMLFRTFFPKEATLIERDREWLNMDSKEMRATVTNRIRAMEDIFKLYYDRIEEVEIFKGRKDLSFPDTAAWAYRAGARMLIRGEKGFSADNNEAIDQIIGNIAPTLKTGSLSSQARFDAGLMLKGWSHDMDNNSGGGDRAFTRIITKSLLSLDLVQDGSIYIIYSLDALSRTGTTYSYAFDGTGTKEIEVYRERENLESHIKRLESKDPWDALENETMINYVIPPQHIKGIIIKSQKQKNALMKRLYKSGLITLEYGEGMLTQRQEEENTLIKLLSDFGLISLECGMGCIRSVPVNEFIHIGDSFREIILPKPEGI